MNKMDKNISIKDFKLLSVIGKGSYAKVLLVKKNDSDLIMALKVLKKEVIERRKQQEHIKAERDIFVSFIIVLLINRLTHLILLLLNCTVHSKMRRNCISPLNIVLVESYLTCCPREEVLQKTSKLISDES